MHNEIVFHEDSYCQIELIPIENYFRVNQESNIIDSTITSFNEDGFENIYSREQIRITLEMKKIPITEMTSLLEENALTVFNSVFKGYSDYKESIKSTFGYAYENYVLFVSEKNGVVSKAWIIYRKISDTLNITPIRLEKTLHQIGLKWHLILIDWNELSSINLAKNQELHKYINDVL